jgi:hypothetical protein
VRGKLVGIVCALLALITLGCGGTETASIALAKRANAICARRATVVQAALKKHRKRPEVVVQQTFSAMERAALELAGLEPPQKVSRRFEMFIAEESEQLDRIRAAMRGRRLPHSGRRDQAIWLRAHTALGARLKLNVCVGPGGLPIFR